MTAAALVAFLVAAIEALPVMVAALVAFAVMMSALVTLAVMVTAFVALAVMAVVVAAGVGVIGEIPFGQRFGRLRRMVEHPARGQEWTDEIFI